MVGGHELERQVFKGDQPIGLDKLSRELMPEVTTSVGDTLVQPGNLSSGFTPSVATLLATGHPALGHSQFRQRGAQPSRVLDSRSITQRQQMMQAHVNTNGWAGMHPRGHFRQVEHQADIPFAVTALEDDMLDDRLVRQWAVVLNLDRAHVLHVEQRPIAIVKAQLAAIAVAIFEAVEAVWAFEPWEAGLFSGLQATEECAEGLVQPAQQLLHASSVQLTERVRAGTAPVAEVCPLLVVGHSLTRFAVSGDALLQSSVVEQSSLPQQEVEGFLLGVRGIEAVLVCADHSFCSSMYRLIVSALTWPAVPT